MSPKPLKDNLRKRSAADLREERDQLGGWIRQPEVRWLDPSILAKAGVEVAVSGTFGKFADKREIQTQPQGRRRWRATLRLFDGELWIDYLSDTGDGWAATQTMAWVLAQPSLPVGDDELPRGKILLLGGDQVYPSATPEAYEDRFKGPFAAALPRSEAGQRAGHVRDARATTTGTTGSSASCGCSARTAGSAAGARASGAATSRSSCPSDWWIWAIDIQLDTYIDDVQLQYFTQPGHRRRRQDHPADRQAELGRRDRRARRAADVAAF